VRAEQRRLLYVAITRARDELTLSWPQAIAYADARQNQIRIDQVVTVDNEPRVVLSKSSMLPAGLAPAPGNVWLGVC